MFFVYGVFFLFLVFTLIFLDIFYLIVIMDMICLGSTLNQVAKLLKERGFKGQVFGLGVVGDELGYTVEKSS